MNKQGLIKGISVVASIAAIPMLSTTVAFAGTSFSTQYQNNASQEASLLQTAQASTVTNTEIVDLSNIVLNMNSQITALYTAEQSLANETTTLPQSSLQTLKGEIKQLLQQRETLLQDLQPQRGNDNGGGYGKGNGRGYGNGKGKGHGHGNDDGYGKGRGDDSQSQQDQSATESQLQSINQQISQLQKQEASLSSRGYNSSLSSLQNSILKLQMASIQYTNAWISFEQNNGTPTTSISAPTGLTVSNTTASGWTASWASATGANSYDIYLNRTEVASNVTGTSYTFSNEEPGTTYSIAVTAVDASNNQSAQSAPVSLTTPTVYSITAPTGLTISNATSNGWTLNWTAAVGASSYNIYVNGTKVVGDVTGTSYTFTGQNPNTDYSVTVTAVGSSNNESAQSAAVAATTLA